MIWTWDVVSAPPISNLKHVLNHSFAHFQWDSTQVGTKFSSTWAISLAVPMVQTILKHSEFQFSLIAVSAVFTSPTDFTQKMKFHQSTDLFLQSQKAKSNRNSSDHNLLFPKALLFNKLCIFFRSSNKKCIQKNNIKKDFCYWPL